MHVDAEQAEVISRCSGVLTIDVYLPTPPHVTELLDQEEELGIEVLVTYQPLKCSCLYFKSVSSQSSD